jgi:RNA polymerase sigma-70 factor (ECF subfamily)
LAHQRRILTYLTAVVGDLADAEDLLQETSVVLWGKFAEYQPGTDFCAWAIKIAQFKALQHLRKTGRREALLRKEVPTLLANQASQMSGKLELEQRALSTCLERLPQRLRRVIRERYERGAQVKSVAELIGLSAVTVRKMLRQAYSLLLACINRQIEREELT